MDNITHTLTGVVMSRAGLNRYYSHPAAVLMLAANAPDIDILAAFGGSFNYFVNHRGITHSIVAAPLMALLPVLIVCAFVRSMRGWKAAYLISLVGIASHLLLDWTNSYGIRLFLPFNSSWPAANLNNIVDLWIWAVLLIAVVGPLLGKLVSSEIGARPGSGRGLAWFAIAFICVYDFGRYLAHQRSMEILNSRIYEGAPPIRVAAFPVGSLSPFEWSGWAERSDAALHFPLNLRASFDPSVPEQVYFNPEPSPALEAARQDYHVKKFLEFAQYPLWRVVPQAEPEGAKRVEVRDWRFPFTVTVIVDQSNRVISSSFHY